MPAPAARIPLRPRRGGARRSSRCAAALLLAAALGCAAVAVATATTTTPPKPAARIVHEGDSGSTISLARLQVLSVRLPENPSTGYAWRVTTAPNRAVASALASYYVQGRCAPHAVGCGGTHRFQWRDHGAGTTRIVIRLFGPAATKGSRTFTLRLVGH